MRNVRWLPVLIVSVAGALSAGTIQFQVTPLGGNLFQYNYSLSGITFQANEELDIRFDPSLYSNLSNGVAPSGFSVGLLQPNNPPGVFGDYSALALVNNPSTAGPFSVRVMFSGQGQPGSQPFFLNLFDPNGAFIASAGAGNTSAVGSVPEPASFTMSVFAFLLLAALWMARRRPLKQAVR
jgi:hypothetical protein